MKVPHYFKKIIGIKFPLALKCSLFSWSKMAGSSLFITSVFYMEEWKKEKEK